MTISKQQKIIAGLLGGLALAFLALHRSPDLPPFSHDFGSDFMTASHGARN
jgi:hypothetical protein